MTVLFTKAIDEKQISGQLDQNINAQFLEVINFNFPPVKPFSLNNKSLIFTSVNGVDAFFKNQFSPKENFALTPFNKIYCIGTKTRLKIKTYGFGVYKTLKNAQELGEFIIENSNNEEFIHFCGNLSLDIIDDKLPLQNIKYRKIITYNTELLYPTIDQKFDALVFFSPSGVRSFAKHNSLEDSVIFSIGNTTSKELKNFTDQSIITSKEQNLQSLFKLINTKFKAENA